MGSEGRHDGALLRPSEVVPDAGPERAPDARATRASHSRWRPWLLLLAILVALRVALMLSVEPFVEERLSRVLGARVDVADVGFAPIDAIVTLRHVVVHAADEGVGTAEAKPTLVADRVRIDVQWLPLLHRSLLVRQLTIEGARIDPERLRGAGWSLERFQHLDPAAELPAGWSFGLDRIALRDTHVDAPHDGTGAPAPDVTVREAQVSIRPRRATAFGRAPNLRVDAVVDGGRLLITGRSDPREDGVVIDALVRVKDAPLDRLAAYGPAPAGSSVAGRVSGRLHYQRDPGRRDRLTGRLRGRQVAVRLPALPGPALAIRRVKADVDAIDFRQRRIAIGTLTLHGARLAVRPDVVAPVPLLDGLLPAEPIDPRRRPGPARRAAGTWSWSVGHLASPHARLIVAGTREATGQARGEERTLAASVSGDNIGTGAYWSPVRASIRWDGGDAEFDGTARMIRGFTLDGRLTAAEVDVAAVARSLGPPFSTLVQTGRGAADLNVELALGADDGPPFAVQGQIWIGDLWLAGADPSLFAFGVRSMDLELARLVPATTDAGRFRPAEISFAAADLASPYLTVTRTVTGWSVDPEALAAWNDLTGAPRVTVGVTQLRAQDGRVLVVDQTARPQLSLDLTAAGGWMRELRLPAVSAGELVLQGTDRRLGPLRLAGARSGDDLTAELSAPAVYLAAAGPYLQRAGLPYGFTGGTGAVRSRLWLAGERWSADTTLTLHEPTLGGDDWMLEQSLGMAPAAAFAALRERHGEIMLQVPLGSGGHELNETVAVAVREALARPARTPLPEAPIQVEFATGLPEPGENAARQLGVIAQLLASRPDVVLELRGAISRQDRRWLAEQAVSVDDIEKPGGLAGLLRAVGWRDQRERIRDALAARRVGRPGRLGAADEEALDALVAAAPPIAEDRLTGLAAARAALVAKLLAERHGVFPTRVVAVEPTAPEGVAPPVVLARFVPVPEVVPW